MAVRGAPRFAGFALFPVRRPEYRGEFLHAEGYLWVTLRCYS
jgi:hypothetical protein